MDVIYQKLYSYLAGQIDDTLQYIAGELMNGDCGRDVLYSVGEQLKHALLTAEDIYLDAEDDK